MTDVRRTRYREVADALRSSIAEGGIYGVGARLPTESELCEQFGVSRHTVREALRLLQDAGMIEPRKGSGSRVVRTTPAARYSMSMGRAEDVLRYAGNTLLSPLSSWAPASARTRRELDLGHGDWLSLEAVRRADDGAPIGETTICVDAEFEPELSKIDLSRQEALFAQLVAARDLVLSRIDQEIYATTLTAAVARRLEATAGEPALGVIRRYEAEDTGCFVAARTVHPADRFRYRFSLTEEVASVRAAS